MPILDTPKTRAGRFGPMYAMTAICRSRTAGGDLNGIDSLAWLVDMLARLQDHPARRIDVLLPWNWHRQLDQRAAA